MTQKHDMIIHIEHPSTMVARVKGSHFWTPLCTLTLFDITVTNFGIVMYLKHGKG